MRICRVYACALFFLEDFFFLSFFPLTCALVGESDGEGGEDAVWQTATDLVAAGLGGTGAGRIDSA